jgi:antitoxin MazE
MKLKVVQIGNSQGIRIPKLMLAECGIKKEVEAEAIEGVIVLKPIQKRRRKNWGQAFKEMASLSDDKLLMPDLETSFDGSDWQWK